LPWPRLSAFESDTTGDSSDGHPLDPLRLTMVPSTLRRTSLSEGREGVRVNPHTGDERHSWVAIEPEERGADAL
jgi:hypothetical protein